ncbi:MAG: hypothetical protein IPL32_05755 [Chloracidobacterium sp.]|nr:hypothetical protein [Chloracidobacterium sp.]
MSKFDRRVKSVIRKTHSFVSHDDLSLIRDYFQDRFEEEAKPDNFDEMIGELESLRAQLRQNEDPVFVARFEELLSKGPAIWLKFMIPAFVRYSEKHPQGVWLSNYVGVATQRYVKDAKKYYEARKRKV